MALSRDPKQLLNHLKPHQAILRQWDFGMKQRARPNHVASRSFLEWQHIRLASLDPLE